jgi:hypothetical protein
VTFLLVADIVGCLADAGQSLVLLIVTIYYILQHNYEWGHFDK